LTLQDRTGVVEALVFPEAFQRLEPILKAASPLLVKARVAVEDVGTRLIVSDARPLDQVMDRPATAMRVRVGLNLFRNGELDRLQNLFRAHPGRCRVEFELVGEDGSEATLESRSLVQPASELVEAVRGICGPDSVTVIS